MIVNEKLWAQQEGHTWANHILMKNKFDLIVAGDNHTQFSASAKDKHLINMGSMMRSTIAQVNHHPAVAVYDTDTKQCTIIDLTIKPMVEVMCLEKAKIEKEKNEHLDSFVSSLKGEMKEGQAVKLDFMAELEKFITTNDVPEEVSDIIYDCV
jgi:hypothetical protein